MSTPEIDRNALRLPRDEGGPVFNEPWEAQAFALAVKLSEQGYFTWKEWAAALAEELKAIQNFQEDLREALCLEALYNESLGTVSNVYVYDRVEGRDAGDEHKPWE